MTLLEAAEEAVESLHSMKLLVSWDPAEEKRIDKRIEMLDRAIKEHVK